MGDKRGQVVWFDTIGIFKLFLIIIVVGGILFFLKDYFIDLAGYIKNLRFGR